MTYSESSGELIRKAVRTTATEDNKLECVQGLGLCLIKTYQTQEMRMKGKYNGAHCISHVDVKNNEKGRKREGRGISTLVTRYL